MEYEKTINITVQEWDNKLDDYKEVSEPKLLIFAIITFEEKNLALTMIEHGLATVTKPYTEEEKSVCYEELK